MGADVQVITAVCQVSGGMSVLLSAEVAGHSLSVTRASATGHLMVYRAAAIEICHRLELTPVFMEEFAPESPPLAVCREKIDNCGAIVLLVAHRYGSRPPGETLGYTEMEYEYALEHGKQLHLFRVDESFPWPPTDVDSGDDVPVAGRA
jgi:Domain of unknown function (DUF4062)